MMSQISGVCKVWKQVLLVGAAVASFSTASFASVPVRLVQIWGQTHITWNHLEHQPIRPDVYETDSALEQQVAVRLVKYLEGIHAISAEFLTQYYQLEGRSFFHGAFRNFNMSDLLRHTAGSGTVLGLALGSLIQETTKAAKAPLEKLDQPTWDAFLGKVSQYLDELHCEKVDLPVEVFHSYMVEDSL